MRRRQTKAKSIRETPTHLSSEAARAVNRFIRETDWDAFWSRVIQRASAGIDAYEKARAKSLASAPGHVFLKPA
jgi:hypothetical protein